MELDATLSMLTSSATLIFKMVEGLAHTSGRQGTPNRAVDVRDWLKINCLMLG